MRRDLQHSFGRYRDTQHSFGDSRTPITSPTLNVSHAIILANGSTYIRLFPDEAQRVLNAAMATNAIFGTPVASLTPLACVGQCVSPTSPVSFTASQFNAVLAELKKISQEAKSAQSSGYKPFVPRAVNTVAQQSIKSVLQPGASNQVHGSFSTDPTMSNRPRLLGTNSSTITDGTPVPDPALVTTVGQQSVDPAFIHTLVGNDQNGPTGPTIPILVPSLVAAPPAQAPSDSKILGMEPIVAGVVGVGVAVALFILLKK